MGQREVIDVEALLIRAYREKQVDRRYHADPRSERALSRLILLGYPSVGGGVGGERVDTSPFATKRIAIERELMGHPDVLDAFSVLKDHRCVKVVGGSFGFLPIEQLGPLRSFWSARYSS